VESSLDCDLVVYTVSRLHITSQVIGKGRLLIQKAVSRDYPTIEVGCPPKPWKLGLLAIVIGSTAGFLCTTIEGAVILTLILCLSVYGLVIAVHSSSTPLLLVGFLPVITRMVPYDLQPRLLIMFLILAVTTFLLSIKYNGVLRLPSRTLRRPLLAFSAWMIFSSGLSANAASSLPLSLGMTVSILAFTMIVCTTTTRTRHVVHILYIVTLLGLVCIMFQGIVFLTGRPLFVFGKQFSVYTLTKGMPRFRAVFPNSNWFGSLLLYSLGSAVSVTLYSRKTGRRTTLRYVIPILVIGLIFTLSRSSLVGALVCIFTAYWLESKTKALVAIMVTAVVGVGAIFLYPPLAEAVIRFDVGLAGREVLWPVGLELFATHPVTGIGFGTWISLPRGARTLHNAYLQILAELGLPGLLLMMWLLLGWLRGALCAVSTRRDTPESALLAGIIGVIAGAATQQLFESFGLGRAQFFDMYFLLFLVLGAIISSKLASLCR